MLPLIQIRKLRVDFPESDSVYPALQDLNLDLNRGEMLAVVGESGSGKSVMALSIMNLLGAGARISSGDILFSPDGIEHISLLELPEKKLRSYRGNRISMIFQEPMTSLNPVMTCGDQICEPLILHRKLSRRSARIEAIGLLEKVQIPDPKRVLNSYPHQLSGGQKQRVMIAMAVSCKPDLLICDEPTTALDVRVQKTILELLNDLRRSENMGMLFITHDLGLVADMADRALVMLKGKEVESGPVRTIFTNPKHPYTKGLLMCRPVLHPKGERLPVVADFLEDISGGIAPGYSDSGKIINKTNQTNEGAGSKEVLLRVRDLELRYSSGKNWLGKERHWFRAIRDINFDVYPGETLGLVGESGSGKTTLGRALLGLNKPSRGTISFGGIELLRMKPAELLAFRRNIQIVFQDPYSSLNPRMMIGPAISEALKVHETLNREERKRLVLDLLKKVDLLPEHYNRYPFAFSGGQRQRVVIARALILNPGFVVFDESVSALDVSIQAQVLNLINDLKRNLGFTSVFISHDLSVIRYLCDRVIVMENGRIVEEGEVEEVYKNPKTEYTRSLIRAIPGKSLINNA